MSIEEELKGRFRNEYHKGLINLSYTVKQLSYNFLQSLKKHKLAESQYNILRVLRGFRSEGAVSIGFLKERMLDKHSDVSRLVDKLHERGLIDRTENKEDRRQKAIVITPKGLELLSAMDECEEKVDSLLSRLDPEEILVLNKLLDKIRS